MSGQEEEHHNGGEQAEAHLYDDISRGRFNVIKAATPLVLKNIGSVKYTGNQAFTICDYGTSDGLTSLSVITDSIDFLKKTHGKDTEIMVLYEDLPDNDFNTLLQKIHGGIDGRATYMMKHDRVFVAAVGTGFHRQCVPSNSIHFGFSAAAMHFLQKRPCILTWTMHHTRLTSEYERDQFTKQAAADWEQLMLLRARELAPGGRMVAVGLGRDKTGQCVGRTRNIKEGLFEQLDDIWKQMLDEGLITQVEYDDVTFSEYYRDEEESISPLIDINSPVFKAGLRLVSVETRVVRCIYHSRWMENGKKGDVEAQREHAEQYVSKIRSWVDGHIRPCLDGGGRSADEKRAIMDELFRRYTDRVAAKPEDHGMDYVHVYLCMEKLRN